MKAISLMRDGLEGRSLKATFLFYLFVLAVASPVALLAAWRGGEQTVYRIAPWLAVAAVGIGYLVCYGGPVLAWLVVDHGGAVLAWLGRPVYALAARAALAVLGFLPVRAYLPLIDAAILTLVFYEKMKEEQAVRQLGCSDDAFVNALRRNAAIRMRSVPG